MKKFIDTNPVEAIQFTRENYEELLYFLYNDEINTEEELEYLRDNKDTEHIYINSDECHEHYLNLGDWIVCFEDGYYYYYGYKIMKDEDFKKRYKEAE